MSHRRRNLNSNKKNRRMLNDFPFPIVLSYRYVSVHGCMKLHFQNQFISLLHERIGKGLIVMTSTMLSGVKGTTRVSYLIPSKRFPLKLIH